MSSRHSSSSCAFISLDVPGEKLLPHILDHTFLIKHCMRLASPISALQAESFVVPVHACRSVSLQRCSHRHGLWTFGRVARHSPWSATLALVHKCFLEHRSCGLRCDPDLHRYPRCSSCTRAHSSKYYSTLFLQPRLLLPYLEHLSRRFYTLYLAISLHPIRGLNILALAPIVGVTLGQGRFSSRLTGRVV